MTPYRRGDVVLVDLPFSDLTGMKRRPAVIVSPPHPSDDVLLIPTTSRIERLLPGEFVVENWKEAGLLFPSAVKRGVFTIANDRILRILGTLTDIDLRQLQESICLWFGLA